MKLRIVSLSLAASSAGTQVLAATAQSGGLIDNILSAVSNVMTTASNSVSGLTSSLPFDMPANFSMGLTQTQSFYGATALLGIVVLHRLVSGKLKRRKITDDFPKTHQKLIIAMATATTSEAELSNSEMETIKEMLNRLSSREYSDDEVRALVQAIEPAKSNSDIRKLGKGLIETQKLAIFKAAHAVSVAGKQTSFSEEAFLFRLAKGLKLPTPEVQAVLAR